MDKNQPHTDLLENLFKQMPDDELPRAFRFNVMQQVMAESIRIKKRNERFGLLAVILASLSMVALAVLAILYMDLPKLVLPALNPSAFPFYVYIGALTLLLLFADHKLRKVFFKGEQP